MKKHLSILMGILAAGLAQGAVWFNGSNTYVVTTATINERGTQSCTLEAWVWPEALGALRQVVSTDVGGRQWSIVQGTNNRWHVYGGGTDVDTGFSANTTQWQHVALAIAATPPSYSMKFYFNNLSYSSVNVGLFTNYSPPLAIGASPTTNQLFRGMIQEVRAWNYARSAGQIQSGMSNAVRGTETGLVAYYRMDEGSGDRLFDQSTNAFHARVHGLATNSWRAGPVMITPPAFDAQYVGLWGGPAAITDICEPYPTAQMSSLWDSASPTNAGSVFPLRIILHVDSNGYARLLQRVILVGMPTNVAVNRSPDVGGGAILTNTLVHYQLYADESRIPANATNEVRRISSTAFPVMAPALCTGFPRLTCEITLRADDPINPFVHAYHPDHGADHNTIAITRRISMTFLDSDPSGANNPAWKSTEWGGIYEETITGLHQNPLYLKGLFYLGRSSREGQLR